LGWILQVAFGFSVAIPLAFANPARSVDRRLVSEFEASDSVGISEDLITANYHVTSIMRGIFSAHAKVWVLTRPKTNLAHIKRLLREGGLTNRELEGVKFVPVAHGGPWLRDFGPHFLLERGGTSGPKMSLALADPIYRDPSDPGSDRLPRELGRLLHSPVIPLSFDLDGGNLLTAGHICLTSHMHESAAIGPDPQNALRDLGCKTLIDLDNAPHVHVDMWVKFVSRDLALVHELDQQTIEKAKEYFGGVPEDVARLKLVLDQKAKELSRHIQVRRLPLPLPYRNVFRSYANALLVNGSAIVPRYEYFGWTREHYPDQSLIKEYEKRVEKIYQEAGFQVVWVNGDALLYNGGGFRCASFQIPRLDSIISQGKGFQGGRTL
jgi:agmatine/peptidylarginine deiminase